MKIRLDLIASPNTYALSIIKFFSLALIGFFFVISSALATDDIRDTSPQPPNMGIFALPTSQQPGPFYSFGQNIIGKNQLQFFLFPNYLQVTNQQYLSDSPSLLYGISDYSSLLITLPIALSYRAPPYQSSGLSDLDVQYEYAFYASSTKDSAKQATLVGGITFPSGSLYKTPATGRGSSTYFLGFTYNESYVNWLWYLSPGALLSSPYQNILSGPVYLYQYGIGRNLSSVTNKYTFFGLIELDGQYAEKTKIGGVPYPSSGGNLILITPSLSLSTQKLIIQGGVSFSLVQHLYGSQPQFKYYTAFSIAYTLN